MRPYEDFLRAKVTIAQPKGFTITEADVNPILKPHQVAAVIWAILQGCAAIFMAFGLGKTFVQLEVLRILLARVGGMGLIVAPLGVRLDFMADAEKLGIKLKFIRSIEEADDPNGLYLTNYETVRDGKLDPRLFSVASLDEAACLRGFGGTKTFREFMALFAGDDRRQMGSRTRGAEVRHRFVATATPSPNEYIELLAYSAFLGVMDVGQAKTRFFKRNSEKADNLTLLPSREEAFWTWVASWALFLQMPSDLGFSDDGYDLPQLSIRWHEILSDHTDAGVNLNGQAEMFKRQAIGVVDAAREKRDSLGQRVDKLMEIINAEFRGEACVQQGLLPQEPGATAGRAEGSRGAPRDGRPGLAQPVREGVLGSEPRGAADEAAGAEQGLLRGEQAQIQGQERSGEAPNLRADAGAAPSDPGAPGVRVPDLPAASGLADGTSDRPLARHRRGPGRALPKVQHGIGPAGGEPGEPGTGPGVLEHSTAARLPQLVVWCDLNDEQRALERAFDAAGITYSSLYGAQSVGEREALIDAWRAKRTTVFLSKTSMYGAGLNLQQAHRMLFAGVHFKFHEVIQAVHRIHRFLQQERCVVDFIHTEAEREVRRTLERKWQQHKEQTKKMAAIIKEFGLSHAAMIKSLSRALGVERVEVSAPGGQYRLVNNDCVLETRSMPDNSVGLILTSIPFSTQYEYSPNVADFGHTDSNEHFFQQMDYLVPELLRVLQPGRIAAIHVKNRIVPGGMVPGIGFQTEYPFDEDVSKAFRKHGFFLLGRKTIITDVVRENASTYRLGYTEQCKDGSRMGFGQSEYLFWFRKAPTDGSRGYADVPVLKEKREWIKPVIDPATGAIAVPGHWSTEEGYSRGRWQFDAHGGGRSSGNRLLTVEELDGLTHAQIFRLFRRHSLENVYDFEHDVKIAEALTQRGMLPTGFMLMQPQSWHPDVWTDITRMRTLNGAQSAAGRESHLCPMQFDIADRAIRQLSNPGDVVYDPFGGLMTVPYRAVLLGRIGWGCELAKPYFLDGCGYCEAAVREQSMPSMFDLDELEAA